MGEKKEHQRNEAHGEELREVWKCKNIFALRAFFKTFLRSVGAQALRGVIIINDPLIIINTREARNIDVHTPRSAWAPTERKNVQLMEINVLKKARSAKSF